MENKIRFSRDELSLINNALNEFCNGVHIDDWEFQTRLDATRDEARRLLAKVHGVLN